MVFWDFTSILHGLGLAVNLHVKSQPHWTCFLFNICCDPFMHWPTGGTKKVKSGVPLRDLSFFVKSEESFETTFRPYVTSRDFWHYSILTLVVYVTLLFFILRLTSALQSQPSQQCGKYWKYLQLTLTGLSSETINTLSNLDRILRCDDKCQSLNWCQSLPLSSREQRGTTL